MKNVLLSAGGDGASATIPHRRARIFGVWGQLIDCGSAGVLYQRLFLMTARRWERYDYATREPEVRMYRVGPLVLGVKLAWLPPGTMDFPPLEE